MSVVKIRSAREADTDRIAEIYEGAKRFQRETGNPRQWTGAYPGRCSAEEDIPAGKLYVIEDGGGIHGVFFFDIGNEPTYNRIFDGCWCSDRPYGFIHRIAGDGQIKGIVGLATDFALERCESVRIDTHRDNTVMQRALAKAGYVYCGIIYLKNGDERLAYQKDKN